MAIPYEGKSGENIRPNSGVPDQSFEIVHPYGDGDNLLGVFLRAGESGARIEVTSDGYSLDFASYPMLTPLNIIGSKIIDVLQSTAQPADFIDVDATTGSGRKGTTFDNRGRHDSLRNQFINTFPNPDFSEGITFGLGGTQIHCNRSNPDTPDMNHITIEVEGNDTTLAGEILAAIATDELKQNADEIISRLEAAQKQLALGSERTAALQELATGLGAIVSRADNLAIIELVAKRNDQSRQDVDLDEVADDLDVTAIDHDESEADREDPKWAALLNEAEEHGGNLVAKRTVVEHGFNYVRSNGTMETELGFEGDKHLIVRAVHDEPDHYSASWTSKWTDAVRNYVALDSALTNDIGSEDVSIWFTLDGEDEERTFTGADSDLEAVRATLQEDGLITGMGITNADGDAAIWLASSHSENDTESPMIQVKLARSKTDTLVRTIIETSSAEVGTQAPDTVQRLDYAASF